MNYDTLKISIYIICCLLSFYSLFGVDFARILRKGQETKIYLLYILLSFAMGYAVAEFVMVIAKIN